MTVRKRKKSGYSVPFPDLSTNKPEVTPVSNVIPGFIPKNMKMIAVPEGYHIGHLHKQGPMIHSNKDVAYTGGRKV